MDQIEQLFFFFSLQLVFCLFKLLQKTLQVLVFPALRGHTLITWFIIDRFEKYINCYNKLVLLRCCS